MRNKSILIVKNDQSRHVGQGMTEYIIIVALIALAAVAAVSFFGTTIKSQFVSLGAELIGGDGSAALTGAETNLPAAQAEAAAPSDLRSYTE